jgi:hypothetical protein
MAEVCKCQTDTDKTDGNAYGQPQVVAERCDVAIPCHVGVPGQTYKHVGAGSKLIVVILCFYCSTVIYVACDDWMGKKLTEHIKQVKFVLRLYGNVGA